MIQMAIQSFPKIPEGGRLLPSEDSKNTVAVHPIAPYRPISASLAIAPTVSVIIPARNEAANLPHVFGTLPPWIDEIILVDGHSVDDTVAVTRAVCPTAKVITQPGRGKGDALQAGFAAATGEILVTIDADGSTDGTEIVRFVSALVAGADYAKGSRFSSSGGSDDITGLRRYGNWLLSLLVNWMFGTHFTDLCYGYNAFWARHRDGWRILKIILRERLSGTRRREPRRPAVPAPAAPSGVTAQAAAGTYGMPGRDGEPSVYDHDIVAAIAERDRTGVAAAFGRYAQALYSYCRSQLTEPAAAADAVRDTF